MVVWGKNMKIKKSHLQRIIREEIDSVLSESLDSKLLESTEAAIASIEQQFGKGSIMNLNTGEAITDTMRTQFRLRPIDQIDSLVALHDDLLKIGRDSALSRLGRGALSKELIEQHPHETPQFIHHHLNRFLQIPASELVDVPSGAQLKAKEIARMEAAVIRRREMPPEPRPEKPYGGGSRNRPWYQGT